MLLWLAMAFFAQAPAQGPAFEVTSVKPSRSLAGPDYNNHFTYSPSGFNARNATLRALIAEAYGIQRRQVIGPAWIDRDEYEIEARSNGSSTREQISTMLRGLLAERFHLRQHMEDRVMRAFELVRDKSALKLQPFQGSDTPKATAGFHFHGGMRQFADLLALQVSMSAPTDPSVPTIASELPVPMLDKTGLEGIFDFTLNVRPEPGTDGLTLWQRAVQDQLGLRIESRRGPVTVLVVDDALKVPTAN